MVLLLQFINWILEAVKLNILLISSDNFNFYDVIKAVYVGNLTALITPKRLGNFIGRSWILSNKVDHVTTASISGNIAQLFQQYLWHLLLSWLLTFINKSYEII